MLCFSAGGDIAWLGGVLHSKSHSPPGHKEHCCEVKVRSFSAENCVFVLSFLCGFVCLICSKTVVISVRKALVSN